MWFPGDGGGGWHYVRGCPLRLYSGRGCTLAEATLCQKLQTAGSQQSTTWTHRQACVGRSHPMLQPFLNQWSEGIGSRQGVPPHPYTWFQTSPKMVQPGTTGYTWPRKQESIWQKRDKGTWYCVNTQAAVLPPKPDRQMSHGFQCPPVLLSLSDSDRP